MTIGIFPGKFDPVTLGHLDIIKRAANLFDTVVVAVFEESREATLFSTEERTTFIKETITDLKNVQVDSFHSLIVDYARTKNATAIIRGLRLHTDFEYEFEMALMNRKLDPKIDVVCLITSLEYQFVRSSLLKEIAQFGGDITSFSPPNVTLALNTRLGS
jgi:pantetheine-phosphate adenylyltransferase